MAKNTVEIYAHATCALLFVHQVRDALRQERDGAEAGRPEDVLKRQALNANDPPNPPGRARYKTSTQIDDSRGKNDSQNAATGWWYGERTIVGGLPSVTSSMARL